MSLGRGVEEHVSVFLRRWVEEHISVSLGRRVEEHISVSLCRWVEEHISVSLGGRVKEHISVSLGRGVEEHISVSGRVEDTSQYLGLEVKIVELISVLIEADIPVYYCIAHSSSFFLLVYFTIIGPL